MRAYRQYLKNWGKYYLILMLVLVSGFADAQFNAVEEDPESAVSVSSLSKVEKSDLRQITKKKESKDDEGFVFAISKILGKDAKNLDALNSLAVHYIERKKEGLAKIILNRALEAHPNSHTTHNNLGIIYLAEGEQRKAINAFKKATSLKANYEIGLANLGSVYVEYGDFKRAVAPLEEGYSVIRNLIPKRDENAIKVASNYAVALAGNREFEKAKRIYREVLSADSRNVGVLYNYASLLVENLKETEEAEKVLSRLKFVADDKRILVKVKRLEVRLDEVEAEKSR